MMDSTMLEIQGATYTWPGSKRRLGPISAAIPKGQFVGLIGPNGAGKSTLLKLIAAYWPHDAGTLRVGGDDVMNLPASARAHRLAFVPQNLETQFDLTVREVVELGRLSRLSWRDRLAFRGGMAQDKLEAILAATELVTLQNRPFNTLSGGEAKRTLLAAALAQEAPFLLLDEPTAHLDPGHAMKFLDLVRDMVDRRKTTVLMAYHDLATVGLYVDTLWVMNEGQIVLTGSPEQVMRHPSIQKIYDAELVELPHPRTHRPMLIFP